VASGAGNGTVVEEAEEGGDEEAEDDDAFEYIHMDEKFYYLDHAIRIMSVIHSIVSLAMLIAYYHLKVQ